MRILKWIAIVLLVLVGVVFGAISYFKSAAQARLDKHYELAVGSLPVPYPLTEAELEALRAEAAKPAAEGEAAAAGDALAAPNDAAEDGAEASAAAEGDAPAPDPLQGVDLEALALERAVARGKRYLSSRAGCPDCHAEDLGGKVLIDAPPMGRWIAPNITPGGVTKDYQPADWLRLIRHGVKPDGRPALMPSQDFTWFSDQEVSDIVAYLRGVPPVQRVMPASELGPVYAMLIAQGEIPVSAEVLDHTTPRAKLPPSVDAVSVALGKHIGSVCQGCHGTQFNGGPIKGGDPAWPDASNLTFHESGLGAYSLEDFTRAMREGVRPDGGSLDKAMPVGYTRNLNDVEIESLYQFLESLEKLPVGS